MLLLSAIVFSVIVVALLWSKLRKERKKARVKGWVIDHDNMQGKNNQIFRNEQYRVSSKPDVVLQDRVIEQKSAVVKGEPKPGDLMQVAAQMISTGKDKAELQYRNKTFNLTKNNPVMRRYLQKVKELSPIMRQYWNTGTVPKGKRSPNECRRCEYRNIC